MVMLKTTEYTCGICLSCEKEHHVHPKLGKQFQAVNLFPVRKIPSKSNFDLLG